MITQCESLVKANQVLVQLQNSSRAKKIDCWVDCYQNGREQGFLLWGNGGTKGIYFAQNRCSDLIAVYIGDYSNQGVSENAFKNRKDFLTCDDAVNYILDSAETMFPSCAT
jgi:hypothetical protein